MLRSRAEKISLCVRQSVSQSVTQNELNALQIASSTDLHQTCHQGRVPGDVVTYCFWLGILNIFIRQTGSGINPHHCSWKNNFNVEYLVNGEIYDVGLKGG